MAQHSAAQPSWPTPVVVSTAPEGRRARARRAHTRAHATSCLLACVAPRTDPREPSGSLRRPATLSPVLTLSPGSLSLAPDSCRRRRPPIARPQGLPRSPNQPTSSATPSSPSPPSHATGEAPRRRPAVLPLFGPAGRHRRIRRLRAVPDLAEHPIVITVSSYVDYPSSPASPRSLATAPPPAEALLRHGRSSRAPRAPLVTPLQ